MTVLLSISGGLGKTVNLVGIIVIIIVILVTKYISYFW